MSVKNLIIFPYFSLSEGENCPKYQFFGIKLSRLAFFGGKFQKFGNLGLKIGKNALFKNKTALNAYRGGQC